jgi:hypothetical protein
VARLHKEVREAVEKVEEIGWKFTGRIDGEGHPVMLHDSGVSMSIPSTPGDWRSLKNSIAQMERLSGQKIDRSGKRRKSHRKFEGSGFSIEEAKREQAEFHASTDVLPVADLWAQRRELIAAMVDLLKCHTEDSDQTAQAATLLWKIRASERALKQLGQSVRDFDLMDLPLPGHVKEAAKTRLKPSTPKPDPKVRQIADKAAANAPRKRAKADDSDGNRAMIEEFLTNLIDGAKVIGTTTRRTRKPKPLSEAEREERRRASLRQAALEGPAVPEGDDPKVVREWLRNNGFPDIKSRGRLSKAHVDAWNNRNKRARRMARSA